MASQLGEADQPTYEPAPWWERALKWSVHLFLGW